jgi:hypothetical protein
MRNRPHINLQPHKTLKHTNAVQRLPVKRTAEGWLPATLLNLRKNRKNTVMSFLKKVFPSVKIKKDFATCE